MKTNILRQADFHSEIDWVYWLSVWRGPIRTVILLVATSALWAAILWPILFFFR
jgi:hypothetical protein